MVTMDTQYVATTLEKQEPYRRQILRRTRGAFARIASWLAICAHYHSAAARYEELAGLSDAELKRRGLSREALAKDVCKAADRECPP